MIHFWHILRQERKEKGKKIAMILADLVGLEWQNGNESEIPIYFTTFEMASNAQTVSFIISMLIHYLDSKNGFWRVKKEIRMLVIQ